MPPKKSENENLKNEGKRELPLPETDESFLSTMRGYCKELLERKELAEKGIVLDYGTYEVKGSSGRDFEVQSVWWPRNPKNPAEIQQSSLRLFTIDKESRKLAAIREIDFGKYDDDKNTSEDSNILPVEEEQINSRFQNIGAASATDTALVQIFEKIATQYSQKGFFKKPKDFSIHWKTTNGNIVQLDDAKSSLVEAQKMEPGKKKDDEVALLEKLITEYQEQQNRWQSLWGKGGKFGLIGDPEYGGEKLIKKNETLRDFKPKKIGRDKYDILTEKVRQASLK